MLIPLCPGSRRRGSGPGTVRCPLGQPGRLAQQTGPRRPPPPAQPHSTAWASERPRIPTGPHSLRAESRPRWREAARNRDTGQGARPARPSWLPCGLPSTLILTECAPSPAWLHCALGDDRQCSLRTLGRRFGFSGSVEHRTKSAGIPGPVHAGGASNSWHSSVTGGLQRRHPIPGPGLARPAGR